MPTLHRECLRNRKNFPFLSGCGKHFQGLAGPINVSVDLKYNVPCL